ncbi:MAG: hypothetical protein DRP08_01760 [Candidatus Aenigmatarchaeota archaeon]|nr:MAG: hypothetical protein DRP08_01760 [Candidatus Aenigmarchaeota archaeon]
MLQYLFEDVPIVKIMDFLLDEPELDYSKTEIAKECKLNWKTVNKVFPKLIAFEILVESRVINRAKMYKLNKDSPVFKSLRQVDFQITDTAHTRNLPIEK